MKFYVSILGFAYTKQVLNPYREEDYNLLIVGGMSKLPLILIR